MGDLKQKTLEGSCLGSFLSYANVWFPHLSTAYYSFTQKRNNPTYPLCLRITRSTWNSLWQKHLFPAILTRKSGEETYDHTYGAHSGCSTFPCAHWCWSNLEKFCCLLAISPFHALWWDVVEHDRHLVLCLGEKQRGEKWGILNTMQRLSAVTIVSIILDMTLMQAQGCL